MSVEILEQNTDTVISEKSFWSTLSHPINGTDARRLLEDKLEDQRLRRELLEFDFELN